MSEGYTYRVTPEGHDSSGAPWRWQVIDRETSRLEGAGRCPSRLEAIRRAQDEIAAMVLPPGAEAA